MVTKIRKIGNSLGVVISKSILVASDITDSDKVEVSYQKGKIIIEKVRSPRAGWAEMIATAKDSKEDLFPEEVVNKFDEEEWTWE